MGEKIPEKTSLRAQTMDISTHSNQHTSTQSHRSNTFFERKLRIHRKPTHNASKIQTGMFQNPIPTPKTSLNRTFDHHLISLHDILFAWRKSILKTPKNREKDQVVNFGTQFRIFYEFFSGLKSIAKSH